MAETKRGPNPGLSEDVTRAVDAVFERDDPAPRPEPAVAEQPETARSGLVATELTKQFKPLNAEGESLIAGFFTNYALIDTLDLDVVLNFGFDYKDIRNDILGINVSEDNIRMFKLGFDVDYADPWGRTIFTPQIDIGVPEKLFAVIKQYVSSKLTFLMLLNIFLLVLGAMLDIFSALVIMVPLLVPVALGYGIEPVHLGMIFLANMQLGYFTPPVGMNLFIASYRFEKPVMQLYIATLPFFFILLAAVLIITYWPWLSLGLLQ